MPFLLLFEPSSGSSWLMQELAALTDEEGTPAVCAVGFEPLDNISLKSPENHAARLRWLSTLWAPPEMPSAHGTAFGEADVAWHEWRQAVLRDSIFGQRPLVAASLDRCNASSVAFGLKARLSRLLSDESGRSLDGLAKLVAHRHVRVIHLHRRNVIKQALAEYRRLHAGLGQFASSEPLAHKNASTRGAAAAAPRSTVVKLGTFRKSLKAVERSRRLTQEVVDRLALTLKRLALTLPEGGAAPPLSLAYEELLADRRGAIQRIATFLSLQLPLAEPGIGPSGAQKYKKATPDKMCEAVRNYAEFCHAFAATRYADFFDEPCEAACGKTRKAPEALVRQ